MRTFLRYLRREEVIDDDPGGLVATPKRDIRMPAHLSEEEMTALLDAPAGDTPLSRRDRAILELFYASGLRLSELTGLDVEDVNLSAKMVRVLGKGGKERIVPFNGTHGQGDPRVSEAIARAHRPRCQPDAGGQASASRQRSGRAPVAAGAIRCSSTTAAGG